MLQRSLPLSKVAGVVHAKPLLVWDILVYKCLQPVAAYCSVLAADTNANAPFEPAASTCFAKNDAVCADDVAADDGQQRKRRGRIGNMAAEPSASMKDSLGNAALEPAENMLADGFDGDRSSGEMLMECVVKVGLNCISRMHCYWSLPSTVY